MSKKIDRALYGPSWAEVILGACLSLLLGMALAAAYLVTKPVETVREMPKEPIPGQIYLVEGSKDGTKGRQWKAKQLQLIAGTSVNLTEDELNTAVAVLNAPKAKPAGAKEEETAAEAEKLALGALNFRIRGGEMQVAVPVTLNVLGLGTTVMVHARVDLRRTATSLFSHPRGCWSGPARCSGCRRFLRSSWARSGRRRRCRPSWTRPGAAWRT
jgi:hypothetical protein